MSEEEVKQLNIGDKAPDFTLPSDEEADVKLSSFEGKRVILYFYPKDNTPGCTTESKDFAELSSEFEAQNTVIIGMSKDSVKSHQSFKNKYELPFTLISDEEVTAIKDFGVWQEKNLYGKKYMGIVRTTFFIDESGVVQNIWNKVKVKNHAAEVLEFVKSL